MKIVGGLLFGAVIGLFAAIAHAAFPPLGLVLAVLGSYATIRLVGVRTGSRVAQLAGALAWIAVILRGSLEGFGGELLIWGSDLGTIFLAAGSLAVVVAVALPLPRDRRQMP